MIVNLLRDEQALTDLQAGLPYAFELAEMEARRIGLDKEGRAHYKTGQEVGIHRERVMLGFLTSKLGEMSVKLPEPGDPQTDVLVGGIPLEIKTVSKRGAVKAKWTADTASAQRVIDTFTFTADMLLIRIWWEQSAKSVFYIPSEVLHEVATAMPDFLSSRTGTNNRGVELKPSFITLVEEDPRTIVVSIDWQRSGRNIQPPIVRYTQYWLRRDYLLEGSHDYWQLSDSLPNS